MSAGSWQLFAEALEEENVCLAELGAAALAMTSALVSGNAAEIEAADRNVDARLILHGRAQQHRLKMMRKGFGDLTLRQVCGYAPGPLRRQVFTSLRQMRTRGIALQITVRNNRTLITAGLRRIANVIAMLQKSLIEQTGTYRRRGTVAPPQGSVIVSRKA